MLRWILLGLTILCSVVIFTTKSALALGLALLAGTVCGIGFVLVLIADRVSSVSRPDTAMASVEQLAALRPRTPAAPRPSQPTNGQTMAPRVES